MENKVKTLYHGSQYKITDGVIHVRPAHTNHMQTKTTAVFATSDFAHAKNYACMRLIAEGWKSPRTSDTLYVQKLKQDISGKKAYIYELDSDGFERDVDGSYYCLTDKKIKNIIEIDVMQEIKNGDLKVYILKDEFNIKNMSKDAWKEILKDKSNFELYNPNAKTIDMAVLAKAKDIVFNK